MKSLFIKLLSFVLLFAMLLPLAVSCNNEKEPPVTNNNEPNDNDPNNNQNNNEENKMDNYYFKLNVDSKTDSTLIDFRNEELVNNIGAQGSIVNANEKNNVLKWNTKRKLDAALPETLSLAYCTSIRFSIYSEKASGAILKIAFINTPKTGGTFAHVVNLTLDFTGWKSFDVPSTQISSSGPKDNSVASLVLQADPLASGEQPNQDIYISNIEITTEKYSVIAPDGISLNDASHYTAITDNARDMFVGNADMAATEIYKNKLPSIDSSCKKSFDLYKEYKTQYGTSMVENRLFNVTVGKDPSADYFTGPQAAQRYYENILAMATAWGSIGSEYYHSEQVLEAIKFALDYGYEFYYGKSFLEYGAYGNWWEWKIGVPINLISSLVIIESELTPEICAKYTEAFDHYVPYPTDKGANKIWMARMCLLSAALRHDAVDLCVTNLYMNDVFDYIDDYLEDEGGFFTDGSFVQHYYYPNTTGYGRNYLAELPHMLYYTRGTRFSPQYDNINNLYKFVLDGIRPVIYDYCHMRAMAGRGVCDYITDDSRSYITGMIILHALAPDEYKAELEQVLAYFMQLFDDSFSANVSKALIKYADDLYLKLKDVQVDPYEITKVFGMMCRTIHQGPEYGVCLSYSNMNIGKYEAINDQNRTGWYHSDGMIQIYTDGYSFAGDFYCFANPYLMPGVTANSAERNKSLFYSPIHNASNYAGGVSQGKYGSTGFILDYDEGAFSISGTPFKTEADTTIYAKKSYFFFDNEIICVGSNISDKSGTSVKTTLDNRFWRPTGETLTIGTAAITSPATVETEITERILHFTNMGGYVLLKDDGAKLYYKKATNFYNGTTNGNTVEGTRDFLELYLDHGIGNTQTGKITADKYFYAYLPEATVQQTNDYLANPDVDLIARNENVHAVIEKKLGIVACNFFNENTASVAVSKNIYGDVTSVIEITSETPSSVMVTKNSDGSYTISISDPTQNFRNTIVSVEIEGISTVTSADANVNATVNGGIISININSAKSLGQTFNLTVK